MFICGEMYILENHIFIYSVL